MHASVLLRAVVEGAALDLLLSLVTTISFYHRAADMIHEPEDLMWCWCAGQMKSPQSTNIGFCVGVCFTSYCS